MSSLNKVQLIGNVGAEPTITKTKDGGEFARFSVATSERFKDKATGKSHEKTEWHQVQAFAENLVNIIKSHVKKGDKIYVEGQLRTSKWKDKSGVERYTTYIFLNPLFGKLLFLTPKDQSGANQAGESPPEMHGEVPF